MAASRGKLPKSHLHKQHKAKSAPGKFFVKSEPQCRVKFLRKTRSIWQFQLNFRVRQSNFARPFRPVKIPMAIGICSHCIFSANTPPKEHRAAQSCYITNNAPHPVWVYCSIEKNIKAIPAPSFDGHVAHASVGKRAKARSAWF
jgi:hypothetical protein